MSDFATLDGIDCNQVAIDDVKVEARVGSNILIIGDDEIDVGFNSVILKLNLDGYEFKPGKRYGEIEFNPSYKQEVEITHTATQTSVRGAGVSAETKGMGAGGGANLQWTKQNETKEVQSSKREVNLHNITVRPNGEWIFWNNEEDKFLNHLIIDNEKTLCTLTPIKGANRLSVEVFLMARKSGIVFNEKKKGISRLFGSINKQRVFTALVAKYISNAHSDGLIVMSKISSDEND